jgi:hypothetical protein
MPDRDQSCSWDKARKQFFFEKKNQKTFGHLEQSGFSYGLGAGGVGFG